MALKIFFLSLFLFPPPWNQEKTLDEIMVALSSLRAVHTDFNVAGFHSESQLQLCSLLLGGKAVNEHGMF